MRKFNKLIVVISLAMALIIVAINTVILNSQKKHVPLYKVELNRIEQELSVGNDVSADDYDNIISVSIYDGTPQFYSSANEYVIRVINGTIYRIEYSDKAENNKSALLILLNASAAALFLPVLAILLFIRQKIIKPFSSISELPQQLAKGTLSTPLKENKSRFFGKFIWGLDMLREKLESSKAKELERAKKEKTFLLSLSHDIKTPLSAIKLYSKALSKGLYEDSAKQQEAAESINSKADEIEGYVNEMIGNLNSDFMSFDVQQSEFYLKTVIDRITEYYSDKLSVLGTEFSIAPFSNCLICGDADRLEEVLQNIIENAIKYGDGRQISISFSDEEDCRLITVSNSGCQLSENELPHIFDSFWRGSNTGSQQGSGLGLYICRRLMDCMGGDIFAEITDGFMNITAVCRKPQ